MMVMVLAATGCVFSVWLATVVSHIGYLRLTRARRPVGSALVLAGAVLLGSRAVGVWLAWAPASLQMAGVCLYLAGCLGYLELRALLSRGYSLRILLDVRGQQRPVSVEELQRVYGDGRGLHGLLQRRLATMVRLRLLAFDGRAIGPLTPIGRAFGVVLSGMRRWLRLDMVG